MMRAGDPVCDADGARWRRALGREDRSDGRARGLCVGGTVGHRYRMASRGVRPGSAAPGSGAGAEDGGAAGAFTVLGASVSSARDVMTSRTDRFGAWVRHLLSR